jgi:hypothetical protein
MGITAFSTTRGFPVVRRTSPSGRGEAWSAARGVLIASAVMACAGHVPVRDTIAPVRTVTAQVPVTGDTLEVILPPSVDVVVGMPRWAGAHYAGITLGTAQRPRIHFRDSIPHAREVWHELAHVEQLRARGVVRYYLGWRVRTAVHGYADNSMEKTAQAEALGKYRAYIRARERERGL